MGWNDLAFLSGVFFFSLFFFFLVLGAQGGRMGWESFLSSGNRKKRQKGKQNAHGTGLASNDDGDGRNLSSCSEDNGNQTESRVEMKRDEMR